MVFFFFFLEIKKKQEKWAILFTQKDAHKCDGYSYELDAHVVNAFEF